LISLKNRKKYGILEKMSYFCQKYHKTNINNQYLTK